MTVVLIAVYVPIGFQGGLTGALFTEFAFTLVGAVTVSAIVALTLSPMMCSRMLKPHDPSSEAGRTDWSTSSTVRSTRVRHRYQRLAARQPRLFAGDRVFALIVLGSIYFLYAGAKSELAPQEDQGIVIASSTPAPNATLEQKLLYSSQVYDIFAKHPGNRARLPDRRAGHVDRRHGVQAVGRAHAGPPTNCSRMFSSELNAIAGARVAAFQPPPLPGSQACRSSS